MHLCRSCEVLLWRRPEHCPSCRVQHPAVQMIMTLPRTSARLERLAVGVLLAGAGVMVLLDRGLPWLAVLTT